MSTPAVLRAEIEHAQLALGETVDALAARPDIVALIRPCAVEPGVPGYPGDAPMASLPGPYTGPTRYTDTYYTGLAYRAGRSRERISGALGPRWPALAMAGSLALLLAGVTARRRRGENR